MTRAVSIALLVAAAVLANVAPAGAESADLWATVNVCDTAGRPDVLGVRASMAGIRRRSTHMFMRFHAQYQRGDGGWSEVARGGDSGWKEVGTAKTAVREAGWSFTIAPPAAKDAPTVLRGVVAFQWRSHGRVVHRASKRTRPGHPGTRGADPPDFSAARCKLS